MFASVSRVAVRQVSARAALPFSTSALRASAAAAPAPAKSEIKARPASICPAGTKMEGLSVLKDQDDPVALKDEEYPAWLWTLLDKDEAAAPTSKTQKGETDFVAVRRRLRAQNRSAIKASNFLKTT
ncbi:uncharacterized protein EHS24_005091 [Apiotrichum porosum]|uniref:Large ribosomal subunit protein mL54 n=1 Tax=Apiotrichum porosum TaxID=105984 RepID=A0A427Y6U8_9TREE|nr:uncharacterized protein EHS24_005091 [Apiotrichum porosum]RSH86817.1 hypothetical protein EHS24_005091 [Apiotrichum porosum]